MNYNQELSDLAGRFETLKDTLAKRKGALSSAVERLAKEHGVDNSADAKKAMSDLYEKIESWKEELNGLIATIDTALAGAERRCRGEEEDDFDE